MSTKIPIVLSTIKAGFASPAEDFIDKHLDLNQYLIKHPNASFFVRVSGDSMTNAGIHTGDILIVDRSLTPKNNDIVVAVIDNEFTVKRLKMTGTKVFLIPENPSYKIITLNKHSELIVWGVVSAVIKKFE